MEKKKKAVLTILLTETALPWLVLVTGIPAMFCWLFKYYEILEILYPIAMNTGVVAIILEFILGIVSFVLFVVLIFDKKTDNTLSIILSAISWLGSGGCILGTIIHMFLVLCFTYGQSV